MKQFILKNIVLAAILVLTLISSIFLIFFIWEKSETIKESMTEIEADVDKVSAINSARKPNSVEQSENLIKADTDALNKKNLQIYRRFGRPYRPALLKLIANISSKGELKTDLPLDTSLKVKPKPKTEGEEGEEEEARPAEPAPPTEEELAVFDPSKNIVVLSYDEDTLRAMLADVYRDDHKDTADDSDSFIIPESIQSEREQIFEDLFNKIIDAPEVVDPSRAEAFRKAAAKKFAQAFAIFREDVQALTLENVTYGDKKEQDRRGEQERPVAHEIFLDALGLPRLIRPSDCKNLIDYLYKEYVASDIIPGLPDDDQIERERLVQELIYANLNSRARPVAEKVIPILRNFQIKENLFRMMKEAGIGQLISMTSSGDYYGNPLDNDADGPIIYFSYTMKMKATMEAIDTFINSLHAAYKDDRVYVVKEISFATPIDDLLNANAVVTEHIEGASKRRSATAIPGATDPSLPPGAPPGHRL